MTPTMTPTAIYQVVVLAPNEVFSPGSAPGFTGNVNNVTAGYTVDLTLAVINMNNYQRINYSDTLNLTHSADPRYVRELPTTINLVNGLATVSPRLMLPNITYIFTASSQNQPSFLNGSSRPIPCVGGALAPDPFANVTYTDQAPATAIEGENQVTIMNLLVTNPNSAGASAYDLQELTVTVKDAMGQGIPANAVLRDIRLYDARNDQPLPITAAITSSDQVLLDFDFQSLLIYPETTRELIIQIDLQEKLNLDNIRFEITNGDAIDVTLLDNTPILVQANVREQFPFLSSVISLRKLDISASYINYPNPFKAGEQSTTIEYFLEQESQVSLKIYNVVGQLVRILADQETQSGDQKLRRYTWDGRNGTGQIVLNGVYFAVLTTQPQAGGESKQLVIKIAVIK